MEDNLKGKLESKNVEKSRIILTTAQAAIEDFYDLTATLRASGVDTVQELIDERRAASARE